MIPEARATVLERGERAAARRAAAPRRGGRAWSRSCVLIVVLLAGCFESPRTPVRIGLVVWPPYEIFFLAQDLGYYDDLDVELVQYGTPAEALRAYQNGLLDGVAMTTDFFLQTAAHEEGHRTVLVIDESAGGDVLVAQQGIESAHDLVGRRIALEMSILGQFTLARALHLGGVSIDDVELAFADIPEHEDLFVRGEVDAVVTYEPVRTQLLDRGAALLFDSSSIPGEIVDVLFVRESLVDGRQDALRGLVDGFFRARDRLLAEPLLMAERVASREGLTPAQYIAALELVELPDRAENQRLLGGEFPELRRTFEKILPVLIEHQKITPDLDITDLTDDRIVRDR